MPLRIQVCPEDNTLLKEILRPRSVRIEEVMAEVNSKRRSSTGADNNNRFAPKYVKKPPLSSSKALSFDSGSSLPISPTTKTGGYYLYGRRDSINKTRFLLVRTSHGDGKQAFKRVTLPGGSTVMQLRKMIEKSMRNGVVKSIWTLPDRVLVEDDSQIAQFADCQKVEVEYDPSPVDPGPAVVPEYVKEQPIDSITPANSTMEETKETTPPQEQQGGETAGTGNDYPITLLESDLGQHSDPGNVTQEDTSSIEGSIPLEAVPSMDVTPVETEGNDTLSEVESVHKTPLRKSVDSDPGDFVKIDNADNGNQEEHGEPAKLKRVGGDGEQTTERGAGDVESKKLPTATVNPLASEEEKKDVEAKSSEVEQPQEVPVKKSEDKSPYGGLRQWMEKNPAAVRCAATAAAVAGLAGIGAFVYARRVRSGGV
ncbi:hypothetical protein V3C99_016230 [Haemonchus contortus]